MRVLSNRVDIIQLMAVSDWPLRTLVHCLLFTMTNYILYNSLPQQHLHICRICCVVQAWLLKVIAVSIVLMMGMVVVVVLFMLMNMIKYITKRRRRLLLIRQP
jgi:hypothetical protein